MRKALKTGGILADQDAQAMTEFVIVIPIILFAFFSCIQTMTLAKTSQLANYAAFSAARSYATSYGYFLKEQNGNASEAHDEARARAKNAALLVLAPVSHAQFGEALPIWNPIRNMVSGMPLIVQELIGIVEGFVVGYVYRMEEPFNISRTGSGVGRSARTDVVSVDFNYLVPMNLPGFISMWEYLHGRHVSGSSSPLDPSNPFVLGGPFGLGAQLQSALEEIFDGLDQIDGLPFVGGLLGGVTGPIRALIDNILTMVYNTGFAGAMHNVRLEVRGVCGFEPWSGDVRGEDGYRTNEELCEGEISEEAQACADASAGQQENINNLTRIATNECNRADQLMNVWSNRNDILIARQAELNQCLANPPNVPVPCAAQQAARDQAFTNERQAFQAAEDQQEVCDEANEDVANASNPPEECSNIQGQF